MWNPLHCTNICLCDWLDKEADWPIAEQDKVRRRAKQKILGRRSQKNSEQTQRETRWACHTEERYQAMWQSVDKYMG